MKKIRLSFLLAAILCIFVCIDGCADNHYGDSKTLLAQSTGTESYLNAYQDILENNILMYDANTDKKMYLCDYLKKTELSISKYSIIDLNGDNNVVAETNFHCCDEVPVYSSQETFALSASLAAVIYRL